MSISILFAENTIEFNSGKWSSLLQLIPGEFHQLICSYRNWQDRQASLLGKLLLGKWSEINSYDNNILTEISIDQNGRPGLSSNLDFNISHSNGMVICAISMDGPVGIDIEKIKRIDQKDFEAFFSPRELINLTNALNPLRFFFEIWTKKEAVLKAVGKGIPNNINKLDTTDSPVGWEGKLWHMDEIFVEESYSCHIASLTGNSQCQPQRISFI